MIDWRSNLILLAVMWSGVAVADVAYVGPDFLVVEQGLKTFRLQAGRYPTEEEGLMALVEKPTTYPADRCWQQVMKKLPLDPWGNPFRYVVSPSLDGGYGVYTTGADGVSHSNGNDPDDLNSWSEDNRGRKSFMQHLGEVPLSLYLGLAAFVLGVVAAIRACFTKLGDPQK